MTPKTLSSALADAVEAVAPSLLQIRGPRRSGSAIACSEHHALTAAHLVGQVAPPVLLADGTPAEARLLGVAPALDLALIEIDGPLQPVRWDEATRRVGEIALPVASGPRAALGLIGRLGGPWRTPAGAPVDRWIEVDGSLPPGFSGGALVATDGSVIGMNTHRIVRGGTTLPASTLLAAMEAILARGSVEPGYLGIGCAAATLTPDQAEAAGQTQALLVVAVSPDSPAQSALTVGDIVLRVADTAVHNVAALRNALAQRGPGDSIALDVLSALQVERRTVTLGCRPTEG